MRRVARIFLMLFFIGLMVPSVMAQSQDTEAPAAPTNILPQPSDTDIWRMIRQGDAGQVSIPDQGAATMIQSEGDNWRAIRNGPFQRYSAIALLGMIAALLLFYAIRGRIRIDSGRSGRLLQRFGGIERFAHWLTASCFIVLALTGLNMIYGRDLIMPLLGKETFALITEYGKLAHNYLAFGFMVGLALMLVLWIRHNIPNQYDVVWLAKGGGLLSGEHPPAKKFNGGQKILFWLVIAGGISLSLSGIALLFPFQFDFFSATFATFNNWFALNLPTDLTPLQEMQLNQMWHGIAGIFLTVVIIGHIYIGSVGMEGAFAAMGSGNVDSNWAKEHHSVWVKEHKRKVSQTPAE